MKLKSSFYFYLSAIPLFIFLFTIIFITFYLIINGYPVLSFRFLFSNPEEQMTKGGIFPVIFGSFYLTILAFIFSIIPSILSGIYFAYYAKNNILTFILRTLIKTLSGLPSIVFGLFGLAFFVRTLNIGLSFLASSLTLSILSIPYLITATEEGLLSVPHTFYEAAIALGVPKWTAIRKIILPEAKPLLLSGIFLAFARLIGEVAPILFTGVAFYLKTISLSPFDRFMALPYHIYILATQHEKILKVRTIAFASSLVLLFFALLFGVIAYILRMKIKKYY
ncbi:MAG: phosphate ABC transporter permease PstA [candidate division WOR-3 bacterium]|nr:phosphate ABC transporter permease PstA [candidate division WOR-3 bacterium]MCX7836771.1 phosphate ABC transporter permease PstA [candidate division WOR-3 bacterium]MDW8113591.1 phosphate ABC transporter permease PstA [candidate division WOR-3 bacterium]